MEPKHRIDMSQITFCVPVSLLFCFCHFSAFNSGKGVTRKFNKPTRESNMSILSIDLFSMNNRSKITAHRGKTHLMSHACLELFKDDILSIREIIISMAATYGSLNFTY
jgi:hypothetical protein